VACRFRFVPTSHGTQLQDRHPFNRCILRSSMRGNPLRASSFDTQFLTEHGNFGFQLDDSCILRIAIGNQRLPTGEHGDAHDADDIQYRISHM